MQHATDRIAPCGKDRIPNSRCYRKQDKVATDGIAACNRQSRQHATLQHGTSFCNMQRCSNQQHATRTTDSLQRKSCTAAMMQRTAWHHAEKTGFQNSRCNRQKIGCNGQHCNMRKRQDLKFQMRQTARLQKTALQHATGRADNMQRCNMVLQPATCSVASTYNLQQAQRTACNGRHATGSIATGTMQQQRETALQRTALQLAEQI